MRKGHLAVLVLGALCGCHSAVPRQAAPLSRRLTAKDPRCYAALGSRGYRDQDQGTSLFGLQIRGQGGRSASDAPSQDFRPRAADIFQHVQRGGVILRDGEGHEVEVVQGRLLTRSESGELRPPAEVVGATLTGVAADGSTVELVVCGVEPYPQAAGTLGYRVVYRSADSVGWESVCPGTVDRPSLLALPLAGTWDESGAHHESATAFTLACVSTGVLAKCLEWGYRPWETQGAMSLAPYHQACSRMARADYCGTGRSHTARETRIDMYDALGVQKKGEGEGEAPGRLSFEAAWLPDGARCLARTRFHEPLKAILDECPERFVEEQEDLGQGDVCAIRRKAGSAPPAPAVELRNRTY